MLKTLHPSPTSGRILPMICRLYLNQELTVASSITLESDQAHYLRSVMRLAAGDEIILFNGCGGEYLCSIEQLARNHLLCRIESFSDISRELPNRIHIVQAACRSEKIETVLQKATELGAASFSIVRSERSSLKLDAAKLNKRLQRWQQIIIEAAEQSGRTIVPKIHWINNLASVPALGLCFTLHPEATATSWQQESQSIQQADDISLAIGPEGGWSQRDIDTLNGADFRCLTFGPRIMRTETAAPALLAAIQAGVATT
ncbi:MAG: 16S rRNA (uracil(1498)-N(3))-methyltransferase [Mariprofundus sp.]|nr:16S rRNA (uracil(1498)-N(3))-methyltransferase [Mariprofundus sp.]